MTTGSYEMNSLTLPFQWPGANTSIYNNHTTIQVLPLNAPSLQRTWILSSCCPCSLQPTALWLSAVGTIQTCTPLVTWGFSICPEYLTWVPSLTWQPSFDNLSLMYPLVRTASICLRSICACHQPSPKNEHCPHGHHSPSGRIGTPISNAVSSINITRKTEEISAYSTAINEEVSLFAKRMQWMTLEQDHGRCLPVLQRRGGLLGVWQGFTDGAERWPWVNQKQTE